MTLYVVRITNATPPFVVTDDAEQVAAWLADGTAAEVYELDAIRTYPQETP